MRTDDPDRPNATSELAAIDFHSPGRFSIDNPPAPPAPSAHALSAPFVLGQTSDIQPFDSPDEARRHVLAMIGQARRSLSLYSPDLDPLLYNHSSIQQACVGFLRMHPRNRLRVLLKDSSQAVRHGHRLVGLSRRLSSNMQIRKLNPDSAVPSSTFLVADDCGVLVCPDPDAYAGYSLYRDPGRARQLQRQFDGAWDHSVSDPDLRSFLL